MSSETQIAREPGRLADCCRDRASSYELLTVAEVAALLKLPVSWVYERTRRSGLERIPHFKLGKYLRFSEREVLQWVEKVRGN